MTLKGKERERGLFFKIYFPLSSHCSYIAVSHSKCVQILKEETILQKKSYKTRPNLQREEQKGKKKNHFGLLQILYGCSPGGRRRWQNKLRLAPSSSSPLFLVPPCLTSPSSSREAVARQAFFLLLAAAADDVEERGGGDAEN